MTWLLGIVLVVIAVAAMGRGKGSPVPQDYVKTVPPAFTGDKAIAVESILEQMRVQGVTLDDLARAHAIASPIAPRAKGEAVGKVFAWLGGIFIVAGLSAYIGMFWQDMNSVMRIIVTLGVGLTGYAWALLALQSGRFSAASVPVLLISLIMQTGGWFVMVEELSMGGGDWRYPTLLIMGVMGLQQLAAFSRFRITLLLFALLVYCYAFAFTLLDLLHADWNISLLVMGVSMIALAHAVYKTAHASLSPLGYGFGSLMFYTGLFDMVESTPAELLFLGAAVGNLTYVSTHVRSGTLLTISTLAILFYICYFTEKHFMHVLGWPVTLMLLGVLCIVISNMAMKIKRKMNAA